MTIQVTALEYKDIPGAISSIQQAFADDPYNNWIFDHSIFDKERNCVSLRIRCEWGIRNALFFVAKDAGAATEEERDQVLGVAMWMPPKPVDQKETWPEWLEGWKLWGKQVVMNLTWGRGGLLAKRYYIWKAAQAQAQSDLWTDPKGYYFCNIVTVNPDQQGKGIGKILFKTVTDKADKEGRCCYLESSRDEPNTKIYERLGFKKAREMKCDDAGAVCMLYCMVRDPQ